MPFKRSLSSSTDVRPRLAPQGFLWGSGLPLETELTNNSRFCICSDGHTFSISYLTLIPRLKGSRMDAKWRETRPSGVYIQPASDANSRTRHLWQAAIRVEPRLEREETGAEEGAQLDWKALAAASGVATHRPGRWDPGVLATHDPGAPDNRANLGFGNSRRGTRGSQRLFRKVREGLQSLTWDLLREGQSFSEAEAERGSREREKEVASTSPEAQGGEGGSDVDRQAEVTGEEDAQSSECAPLFQRGGDCFFFQTRNDQSLQSEAVFLFCFVFVKKTTNKPTNV